MTTETTTAAKVDATCGGDIIHAAERRSPWEGLGLLDNTQDALRMEDVWEVAPHLASHVKLVPIRTASGVEIPRHYATVRTYDNEPLGVVGQKYQVVNNTTLTDIGDAVIDAGGANVANVLDMRGGALFVVVFRMPSEIKIGGLEEEQANRYLTLTNSHDGSSPVTAFTGIVRSVCQNTLAIGLKQATNKYTLRHTQSVDGRLQEIREALQISFSYEEEFVQFAEGLLKKRTSQQYRKAFMDKMFPVPSEDGRGKTIATNRRELVQNILSTTDDLQNIKETRWGLLQAVVQYNDHHLVSRETKTGTTDENRFARIWGGSPLVTKATGILAAA